MPRSSVRPRPTAQGHPDSADRHDVRGRQLRKTLLALRPRIWGAPSTWIHQFLALNKRYEITPSPTYAAQVGRYTTPDPKTVHGKSVQNTGGKHRISTVLGAAAIVGILLNLALLMLVILPTI